MKGGHSRSGRAPDPNALRRDRDSKEWAILPAGGRVGDAPAWPLDAVKARERELWDREWARPQAVMWEANHQELEVALYVRSFVEAEAHGATTASRTLVRQQMDALGITVPGLRANRWLIVDEQPARQALKATGTDGASARDRMKVLEGGGA